MPLSKTKDRERKRQSRLDTRDKDAIVQPNHTIEQGIGEDISPTAWVDADGNVVYDD